MRSDRISKTCATSVMKHPHVEVLTGTKIKQVQGFVGQFTTTVEANGMDRDLEHGVAILATGAHSLKPDLYLYGQDERVTRWHELEDLFEKEPKRLREAEAMAFIQCVGSREPERPYCSKICCTASVQQAIEYQNPKSRSRCLHPVPGSAYLRAS